MSADLQGDFGMWSFHMYLPKLSLEEVHLVLKGLGASYILMEGADESGRQDVPLLTAEFHRRLNAIIHYQREELMHRVRAKVGKLTKEKKELIYKTLKLGKNPPHPYPSIPTNENKLSLFSPSKYLLGVHLLFFFFFFISVLYKSNFI